MELTSAEMFSGIGGMRLGLQKSGWKTIWANEIDKYACQIYRKNFGNNELIEADIRTINPNTIPNHVLLTAGFPCQPYSCAGKRQGFQDVRGTLFYEILRVIEAKKPTLLLLENVEGILSNDYGKTFGTILEKLGNLGYWCEWQVINSRHWVPQNRPRVFIVGHSRERNTKQVFPVTASCGLFSQANRNQQASKERIRSSNIRIAGSLLASYSKTKDLTNMVASALSHRYAKDGAENLILTSHTKANIKQRNQTCDTTWTLDATTSKMALVEKSGIRRLTPTECERLQSFPDGWTGGVSDTQRYKLLGNAVTAKVIEFLGQHLSSLF